jgi:hypothetical protein
MKKYYIECRRRGISYIQHKERRLTAEGLSGQWAIGRWWRARDLSWGWSG